MKTYSLYPLNYILNSTDDKIYTYPRLTNNKIAAMTYSGYYMRKYVEPSTVKYVSHDDNDIVMIDWLRFCLIMLRPRRESIS